MDQPAVSFARELEDLIAKYAPLCAPADIGLVLTAELTAIMNTYCPRELFAALSLHYKGPANKPTATDLGLPS
jgi:hypothetical protein